MPFTLAVTLRFLLGATVAWGLLYLWRQSAWPGRALWRSAGIAGGTSAASMLCTYWASQALSSGLVAVLFGLIPLMTALFARLWLQERLGRIELAAIALGMAGLLVVFAGQLSAGPQALWPASVVLLAVALQAGGAVLLKRHSTGQSALAINACALLVCMGVTGLAWLGSGATLPSQAVPASALGAIVYLGIVGSALGFSVYYRLIQRCRPISVALISLLTPATALWLGHAVNQEAVPAALAGGSALIIAGLLLHVLAQRS